MKARIFGLGAVLLGACSSVDGLELPPESDINAAGEGFYYEDAWVWHEPTMSVCWETSGFSTEKGWVRNIVETTYEPLFNIDFTGWGTCGSSGAAVVIRVGDNLWPSMNQKAASPPRTSPNMFLNFFVVPSDLNGDGVVDPSSCWRRDSPPPYIGITGRFWSSERKGCVSAVAVHEFGHALGIDHEHDRVDNHASCGGPGSGVFTAYGYWDITSISNYCNPAWNGDGYLSPLDVHGLAALYGSKVNDVVWYGIGDSAEYGGTEVHQTMYDIRTVPSVGGTYQPVAGDFNGDGMKDVVWYATGGTDYVWFGKSTKAFDDFFTAPQIGSGFRPVAGDFDGDGNDDIYWKATATNNDRIWWGKADNTFLRVNVSPFAADPSMTVVAGDFDGDEISDLFFYSSSTQDVVLWGQSNRVFFQGAVGNVTGTYRPFTGDFDGDGRSDVFWYAPGSATDRIWWGNDDRSFSSSATAVSGTYDVTVGDFDGNGTSDVLWSGSGINDSLWLYDTSRGARTGTNVAGPEGATPFSGDFDGDGIDDVFWYTPG